MLVAAQQPPPDDFTLRVDVRLVNLDVAVTDAKGNFIPTLSARNFRLREDGVPQKLEHFAPTRAPVRVALLVEASPAVFLIRSDHIAAARTLLTGLRPQDEAALLTYASTARREVDFTRDRQRVEHRLANLGRFGLGMAEIHLNDAVAQTLAWLSPPPQRTAVVVIGTGLDTGSQLPWAELEPQVGAGQLTFFAVATGRLLRGDPEEKEKRKRARRDDPAAEIEATFAAADARLRRLAAASAGQAYFPRSAEELDTIYREIAERLRNLYSLGYYPTNRVRNSAYREIQVELVDDAGEPLTLRDGHGNPIAYRVFARPGYFARPE